MKVSSAKNQDGGKPVERRVHSVEKMCVENCSGISSPSFSTDSKAFGCRTKRRPPKLYLTHQFVLMKLILFAFLEKQITRKLLG